MLHMPCIVPSLQLTLRSTYISLLAKLEGLGESLSIPECVSQKLIERRAKVCDPTLANPSQP